MIPFLTVGCAHPVYNLITNHAQFWHGSSNNGYHVGIPPRVSKSFSIIHRPSTPSQIVPLWHWKTGGALNASVSKRISLFSTWKFALHSPRSLFARENCSYAAWKGRSLGLFTWESRTNSSSCMISSMRHKKSISWTFLNDAMAISAKEMPKNHTDKERFAAASSCIDILTLLLPRKRRCSSPSTLSANAF